MTAEKDDRRSREITVHFNAITKPHRNFWSKIESVSRALSIAAIPIVLGIVGFRVQARVAQQGVKPEYVKIAVSLLQERNNEKVSPGLRQWAAELLNDTSPTKLPPALLAELKSGETSLPTQSAVPFSGGISASPGTIRRGESAQLRWNSSNAKELMITPSVGPVGPSGAIDVFPTTTTTYKLAFTGVSGERSEISATVVVVGSER